MLMLRGVSFVCIGVNMGISCCQWGGGGWYFLAVSDGLIMYIYLIFICILYVHHRQADSL